MTRRGGRCHVCGRRESIDGYTRDNRVVLTCGDAVEPERTAPWSKRARLHPECRESYKADRRHGLVYPAVERRLAVLEHRCYYCAKALAGGAQ